MTPAARLQAAIELTAVLLPLERPADQLVASFLRSRRYIGAGDRRRVLEIAYGVLRCRAKLLWWLERQGFETGDEEGTARALVIAFLILLEEWSADRLAGSFDGQRYNPPRLSDAERHLAKALEGQQLEQEEMTPAILFEVPDWLWEAFEETFDEFVGEELQALLYEAPVDLRVNRALTTREKAKQALAAEEIETEETPLSPLGLRVLDGRAPIAASKAFREGLVEVQDEGSQLIALMVGAKPGMRVADFCAGAGGKTLALAGEMENKGQLLAMDVMKGRLDRAQVRIRRAGYHNIERKLLRDHRDPWLKRRKGKFERVLVDAPCSGVGAWRRNPDARWRIGPEEIERLSQLQGEILESAQRLVQPGGRLVYATCSLLAQENENQVAAFLANHPEFHLLPAVEGWRQALGEDVPFPGDEDELTLTLTPARHGCDGFFMALLERNKE
ncbi:RsmB/NOP family class I SAM-dependent RNA methyltransferase [Limibacillus halophilus]